MNTSNVSTDLHFMDLVHRERLARLPYGVIVLLFYLIGIIGNSHVIHIFRRMARKMTPSEAVIMNLAMFDLLTLVLFVAKEYERLHYVLYNRNEIVCKITNYFGFTSGLASSLYVLVLSVYRHQRLYNPGSVQTTVARTVIKLIACFISSAIISIPVPFVVGFQYFQLEGFHINRCWIAEEQAIESLPEFYNIFLLVFASLNCCIMGICNIRIARALQQSNLAIRKKMSASEMTTRNLDQTDINDQTKTVTEGDILEEIHNESNVSKREHIEEKVNNVINSESNIEKNGNQDGCTTSTADIKKQDDKDDVASEEDVSKAFSFTITILFVTVTIMISYILFLCLYMYVIYKRSDPNFRIISVKEDAFFTYATDIVCLNAVVNPFVYFFSDRRYRKMVKSIYKRKQRIYDGSFRIKQF